MNLILLREMDDFTSVIEKNPEMVEESDDSEWDVGSASSEGDDSSDAGSGQQDGAGDLVLYSMFS